MKHQWKKIEHFNLLEYCEFVCERCGFNFITEDDDPERGITEERKIAHIFVPGSIPEPDCDTQIVQTVINL